MISLRVDKKNSDHVRIDYGRVPKSEKMSMWALISQLNNLHITEDPQRLNISFVLLILYIVL